MFNGNDYVSASRLSLSLSLSYCCVVFTVLFCSVALTDFNRVLVLPARGSCVLYQLKFAFEKPLRRNVYVYMYYIWRCQQRSQQRRRLRRHNEGNYDRQQRLSQIQVRIQTQLRRHCADPAQPSTWAERASSWSRRISISKVLIVFDLSCALSRSVNHPTPSREGNSICVLFFFGSHTVHLPAA